ncbi:hypothetical protein KIPB_000299, partial [Kipferlia bialata]
LLAFNATYGCEVGIDVGIELFAMHGMKPVRDAQTSADLELECLLCSSRAYVFVITVSDLVRTVYAWVGSEARGESACAASILSVQTAAWLKDTYGEKVVQRVEREGSDILIHTMVVQRVEREGSEKDAFLSHIGPIVVMEEDCHVPCDTNVLARDPSKPKPKTKTERKKALQEEAGGLRRVVSNTTSVQIYHISKGIDTDFPTVARLPSFLASLPPLLIPTGTDADDEPTYSDVNPEDYVFRLEEEDGGEDGAEEDIVQRQWSGVYVVHVHTPATETEGERHDVYEYTPQVNPIVHVIFTFKVNPLVHVARWSERAAARDLCVQLKGKHNANHIMLDFDNPGTDYTAATAMYDAILSVDPYAVEYLSLSLFCSPSVL